MFGADTSAGEGRATFLDGEYYVIVSPPAKWPVRIALRDAGPPLEWSTDNMKLLSLNATGREAILNFKIENGTANIFVRTKEDVYFNFGVKAEVVKVGEWRAMIRRIRDVGR